MEQESTKVELGPAKVDFRSAKVELGRTKVELGPAKARFRPAKVRLGPLGDTRALSPDRKAKLESPGPRCRLGAWPIPAN